MGGVGWVLGEEGAERVKGGGDLTEEGFFVLDESAEAIRAKDLQGTEEDKVVDDGAIEVSVLAEQVFAKRRREISPCLPQETDYIVVARTTTTTLKIDEIGLVVVDHNVSALAIADDKGVLRNGEDGVGEGFEVVLEGRLIDFG